jgi:hypothetical protein
MAETQGYISSLGQLKDLEFAYAGNPEGYMELAPILAPYR